MHFELKIILVLLSYCNRKIYFSKSIYLIKEDKINIHIHIISTTRERKIEIEYIVFFQLIQVHSNIINFCEINYLIEIFA